MMEERFPTTPPKIKPVDQGINRPLWSVMIPAYNCADHLIETIKSVLDQDFGLEKMQIEVVDDCSTDADVEALVKEIGKGRVGYFRQEKNVGSLRNFETCINRANGYYIHLLHGDDRVLNGYYAAITSLFDNYPTAGAAFSAWRYINHDGSLKHFSSLETDKPGILDSWLYKMAERSRLQYVAITVKREVYEKLGSFYLVTYGEDWEMWARIATAYPVAYTPEYLAEYREHKNSISWRSYQDGQNIKDIIRISAIIADYLPKKDRRRVLRSSRRAYIHWGIQVISNGWFTEQNKPLAYNQLKTILSVYVDGFVIKITCRLLFYIWTEPYRKYFRFRPKHLGKIS